MSIEIKIDATKQHLTITDGDAAIRLKGKNFQFICLICGTTTSSYLSREDVQKLPAWSAMLPISAGKQVARLVAELRHRGLDLIQTVRKTDGWRLTPAILSAQSDAEKIKARQVLASLNRTKRSRFAGVSENDLAQWALKSIEAILLSNSGDATAGYRVLRDSYIFADHPDLRSISNLLASRIGQRMPDQHLPAYDVTDKESLLYVSVSARSVAAFAITSKSSEWVKTYKILEVMLSKHTSGDPTTEAIILNGLSVLSRRLGRLEEALRFAKEACPLAIFSGDMLLMQSALFNFGNIVSEIQRSSPDQLSDIYLPLLEMDVRIRRELSLGKDSAQAELLLAFLHYERADHDLASRYLEDAKIIIDDSQSKSDLALYLRVSGLLGLATANGNAGAGQKGLDQLERSIKTYTEIGNKVDAALVSKERQSKAILSNPS